MFMIVRHHRFCCRYWFYLTSPWSVFSLSVSLLLLHFLRYFPYLPSFLHLFPSFSSFCIVPLSFLHVQMDGSRSLTRGSTLGNRVSSLYPAVPSCPVLLSCPISCLMNSTKILTNQHSNLKPLTVSTDVAPHNSQALYSMFNFARLYFVICCCCCSCYCCLICLFFICLFIPSSFPYSLPPYNFIFPRQFAEYAICEYQSI